MKNKNDMPYEKKKKMASTLYNPLENLSWTAKIKR
jgi:hypothetical protein